MKTTFIVSALAATALSKPLFNKKWVVYTTEVDVVTATVTAGGSSGWSWGDWRHHTGSPAAATSTAAPTTAEAPAPTAPAYTPPAPAAPAPAAPAPASPSAPASSAAAAPDSYSQAILDQHNNHRANSSAPPLSWSTDMANIAAQIAASCVYAHDT